MQNTIKKIIKPLIPQSLLVMRRKQLLEKEFKAWEAKGCPVPPPHIVKQKTITEYADKYGYGTLVETGTFLGDMVEAQKSNFKKIISIELGADLHAKAVQRFSNDKHVQIVLGDSGAMLPEVVRGLDGPAIFWLDGHYSAGITAQGEKDCPIFEEIDGIFDNKNLNHILLIDDARHFTGKGDYPTIEKLTDYVRSKNDAYQVEVKHDIIRFVV